MVQKICIDGIISDTCFWCGGYVSTIVLRPEVLPIEPSCMSCGKTYDLNEYGQKLYREYNEKRSVI